MPLIRRLSIALLITTTLLALGAGVVAAKIPYFSIEVSPTDPTAGDPVTVVVRFWNDPAHTVPADWPLAARDLDRMLAFVSDGETVGVDLARALDGSYRSTLTLPAGSWTLTPFPESTGPQEPMPGFQAPIGVSVAAATPASAPTTSPAEAPLAFLAQLALLAAAASLVIGTLRQHARHAETAADSLR